MDQSAVCKIEIYTDLNSFLSCQGIGSKHARTFLIHILMIVLFFLAAVLFSTKAQITKMAKIKFLEYNTNVIKIFCDFKSCL